jgi:hypothetical protein
MGRDERFVFVIKASLFRHPHCDRAFPMRA